MDEGQDIRIQAASTLAQFRQEDAAAAINLLYQQTQNGELIADLQIVAPNQVGAWTSPKEYFNDPLSIRDYALENDEQFLPQITATFQKTTKPDVKAAAAWALATMTDDPVAINYLVKQSQIGLSESNQSQYVDEKTIISYLGTIQAPVAKDALEAALDNKASNPNVIQTAIVNLIYNQGGSDKAVQVVANQLRDPAQAKLPWDFTLGIAAQLLNNSQI